MTLLPKPREGGREAAARGRARLFISLEWATQAPSRPPGPGAARGRHGREAARQQPAHSVPPLTATKTRPHELQ